MAEETPKQEEQSPLEETIEAPAEAEAGSSVTVEAEVAEAEAEEVPVDEQASLLQQLEEEQQKAAEYYDQWLRSVAELRNYKKRVEQERQHLSREANAVLTSHLLPVLDDFERAMAVLPDEQLAKFSWVEGILLIYRRLYAVLEQHGLQPVETVGQPFDPYVHEGILFEEVPAGQDQIVLAELQRGYKLNDRLLRPALVKVGRAVQQTQPSEEAATQPGSEEAPEEPPPQSEAAVENEDV